MQKLSETVYSTLFWLISSLLVWLVVFPVALIGLPVMILLKAAGSLVFKTPSPNQPQAEATSHAIAESQRVNATQPLLTSFLLKILITVPALLAAAISLQPTRFMRQPVLANKIHPQPLEVQRQSASEVLEVPTEE
jgi:hypothetical protein